MADLHIIRDAPRGLGDDLETARYRMESAQIISETREVAAFDKAANELDIIVDLSKSAGLAQQGLRARS